MKQPLAPLGRIFPRTLFGFCPCFFNLLLVIVTAAPSSVLAAPLSDIGHDRLFSPGQVGICIQNGPDAGKLSADARKQLPPTKELGVGEWSIIGEVCPGEKFFPTSVLISPGATYVISATGRWKDLWITTGPEGWWFPPIQAFNRIPWRRMFLLSGSMGPSLDHAFIIGRQTTWSAPVVLHGGMRSELQLFPNDWESKYDNNRSLTPAEGGPLRVTIWRKS